MTKVWLAASVPVLGVQFKTLEARRYQDPQAKQALRVDHNSNLGLVQRHGDDQVRIEFAFTTSYGAVGMVKVEGTLMWKSPDGAASAEAVVTQWNKDRNLPPERAQEIHTAILGNCIPEAVVLAKGIRLPPPVPIPQVQFGNQAAGAAGAAAPGAPAADAGVDAA